MKLNKGKVDNLNKKILSSALALTLTFTTLTGCAKGFKYQKEIVNGEVVTKVSGKINSDKLRLIELEIYGEKELYLTMPIKKDNITEYWDVFENYKVIELRNDSNAYEKDDDIKVISNQSYDEYLKYYGYKGNSFDIDELKESFNITRQFYEFNENKTIVKK